MKLRGKHAQQVESVQDALAKLGSGKMKPTDISRLQSLLSKQTGIPATLGIQANMLAPMTVKSKDTP